MVIEYDEEWILCQYIRFHLLNICHCPACLPIVIWIYSVWDKIQECGDLGTTRTQTGTTNSWTQWLAKSLSKWNFINKYACSSCLSITAWLSGLHKMRWTGIALCNGRNLCQTCIWNNHIDLVIFMYRQSYRLVLT